jgi:hypothetical protein
MATVTTVDELAFVAAIRATDLVPGTIEADRN